MAKPITLIPSDGPLMGTVALPISKSTCNRMLILSKLACQDLKPDQLSTADDSQLLFTALNSNERTINVENAGTAFRFLTAFFSIQNEKEIVLTGSEAMQKRPIGPLVEALRSIGAEIEYEGEVGFPPLLIKGKKLDGGHVKVSSDVSSQFISALMLIGSTLEKGIVIELEGQTVSSSYITLTSKLIVQSGGNVSTVGSNILVKPSALNPQPSTSQADWSSASYFYGMAALRPGSEILLGGLTLKSIQGDSRIAELMAPLGVRSEQTENSVLIHSSQIPVSNEFKYNLSSEPDLVQTLACVHAGRGDEVFYTGIDHLKFKETNRLSALKKELAKFNVEFKNVEGGWRQTGLANWNGVPISTYQDHRMAMAFSTLSLKIDGLEIENPEVVSKSFPDFWNEVQKLGVTLVP